CMLVPFCSSSIHSIIICFILENHKPSYQTLDQHSHYVPKLNIAIICVFLFLHYRGNVEWNYKAQTATSHSASVSGLFKNVPPLNLQTSCICITGSYPIFAVRFIPLSNQVRCGNVDLLPVTTILLLNCVIVLYNLVSR
ncbi:hypothetical protein L9F63_010798, partial [Diploptera punctata]